MDLVIEIETTALDHASYDASWLLLVVAALVLIPGFVTALIQAIHSARHLREVLRVAKGGAPKAGREGILVGVVERLEDDLDEAPFVRAEVRQRGLLQSSKNGSYITWSADGPPVTTARPFGLRLSSGELIPRVEPGERVRLLDALAGTEILDELDRLRFAALEEGERAQVLGRIEERPAPGSDYRKAGKALVPVAPESRETWIASQDELLRVIRRRAVGYGLWTAIFAAVAAFIVSGPASDFFALVQRGQVIVTEIVRVEIRTTKHKGNLRYHYRLVAKAPSGELTAEIREAAVPEIVGDTWSRAGGTLKALPGRTTSFTLDRENSGVYALGKKPAMEDGNAFAILILTALSCVGSLMTWLLLRPWWEKELVNETERR